MREIIPGTAEQSKLVPAVDMRGVRAGHRQSGGAAMGGVGDGGGVSDMRVHEPAAGGVGSVR